MHTWENHGKSSKYMGDAPAKPAGLVSRENTVFLGKKRIPNWGFGGFRPRKRFDKARRCPTPGRLPPSWRVPGVDRV